MTTTTTNFTNYDYDLSFLLLSNTETLLDTTAVDPFQEDYFNAQFQDIEGIYEGYNSSDYSSYNSSPISTPPITTPPQDFNYYQPAEKKWRVDNGINTFVSTTTNHNKDISVTTPTILSTPIICNNNYVYTREYMSAYKEAYPYVDQVIRKRKIMDTPDLSITLKAKIVRSKVKSTNVQCAGINRKKNCQCKNAALMEYIGPRPIYCAEHIELDPNSLYEKCKSSYYKNPGDGKSCKEVVLKEFGTCHKHFHDFTAEMIRGSKIDIAKHICSRIRELYIQTEAEATAAKRKDSDLFQRKNKLLPKFAGMLTLMTDAVEAMSS